MFAVRRARSCTALRCAARLTVGCETLRPRPRRTSTQSAHAAQGGLHNQARGHNKRAPVAGLRALPVLHSSRHMRCRPATTVQLPEEVENATDMFCNDGRKVDCEQLKGVRYKGREGRCVSRKRGRRMRGKAAESRFEAATRWLRRPKPVGLGELNSTDSDLRAVVRCRIRVPSWRGTPRRTVAPVHSTPDRFSRDVDGIPIGRREAKRDRSTQLQRHQRQTEVPEHRK
jgi:hypothetical protein